MVAHQWNISGRINKKKATEALPEREGEADQGDRDGGGESSSPQLILYQVYILSVPKNYTHTQLPVVTQTPPTVPHVPSFAHAGLSGCSPLSLVHLQLSSRPSALKTQFRCLLLQEGLAHPIDGESKEHEMNRQRVRLPRGL